MDPTEWTALQELLWLLVLDWRTSVLMALVLAAAFIDCRTRRIPNKLVLFGVAFGIAYNIAFPPFPKAGVLWPLQGLGLGFIAFVPFYALGVMGAGDVKLMAMVGAFLGPLDLVWVILCTLIAGGALSVLWSLVTGKAGRMFRNLAQLSQQALFSALSGIRPSLRLDDGASVGKLPYAVAIAFGTIGYLILHPLGFI